MVVYKSQKAIHESGTNKRMASLERAIRVFVLPIRGWLWTALTNPGGTRMAPDGRRQLKVSERLETAIPPPSNLSVVRGYPR